MNHIGELVMNRALIGFQDPVWRSLLMRRLYIVCINPHVITAELAPSYVIHTWVSDW